MRRTAAGLRAVTVVEAIASECPKPVRGRAKYRSETRKAIIDAARQVFATEGLERFSLMRVAEAAQLAAPTLYSYFAGKSELMTAIVAEDLAELAIGLDLKSAHEGEIVGAAPPPATENENVAAEAETPAATVPMSTELPCTDEQAVMPAAAEMLCLPPPDMAAEGNDDTCVGAASAPTTPPPPSPEGPDIARVVADIQSRLSQVEARRADPWLERRLREFERMLSALDERISTIERGLPAVSAPFDADMQDLRKRLDALEKKQEDGATNNSGALEPRFEAARQEQHQMWNELRARVLEQSSRIEILERERDRGALVASLTPGFLPDNEVSPAASEEPDNGPHDGPLDAPHDVAAESASDDDFLAAARRAALAAQVLNRTHEKRRKTGRSDRFLVGLGIALSLSVVVTGFALKITTSSAQTRAVDLSNGSAIAHRDHGLHAPGFAGAIAVALGGSPRAKTAIGLAFLEGKAVPKDDARAARWLNAGAVGGDPVAQYALGVLFADGRGERKDLRQAVRWYSAAASRGNLKAAYRLAICYAEGWGAVQDYAAAARWFARAADSGLTDAQYDLAVLYERGLGVPQSLMVAYKWYALAAAHGDSQSAARVDALSSQMDADDLAAARAAVDVFVPAQDDPGANSVPTLASGKSDTAEVVAQRNG